MNTRDREFLREYTQFSGLNHIIAAVAFYDAGLHADRTAARLIQEVDLLGDEEAADSAKHLNEGARVQTVLIGRLMAELVAGIEDVAALAWAVRERRKGLFSRYMRSSVGEAVMLLDLTQTDPPPDLPELLRLPPLTVVKAHFDEVAASAMERDYASMPQTFAQMGAAYRQRPGESGLAPSTLLDQPPDDSICVVLELLEDPNKQSSSSGTIVETYNKLKHRFTMFENLGELGPGIRYSHLGRDPRTVKDLFDRVVFVSRIGLELAHIVAALSDAGLDEASVAAE